MSEYIEAVKKRFIAGDLSKPEELYPLLINELAVKKQAVTTFINASIEAGWLGDNPQSIIDIGGGKGDLITKVHVVDKYVIDKRKFSTLENHKNIKYINDEYQDMHTQMADIAVFSEFLHLFSDAQIAEFITGCKAKYIIVVENIPDDFLDLRLRLWTDGRCIEPALVSKLLDTEPSMVNDYFVWIKEINRV